MRGVLIAFAFVLLAAMELSLRLFGVAAPETLLIRKQQGPLDVYQLNPRVGLRYFPEEMERIMPKPGFQFFAAKKPEDALRVFVLGGSTTAGFPYPLHGSFANLLRIRLEPHLPGRSLEVINCGLTALNSYAVADFVRELSDHEPDLYVVYAGHNEFYGALGPGSRVAFGRSRGWINTVRWVLDLRISRLLAQGIDAVRGDAERVEGQTLMGAMVGRTGIRQGDATWNATIAGYEANLEQIVRAAGDVPVLFCEVVSNLRDQYPFESLHGADISNEEAAELDRTLESLRNRVESLNPSDDPEENAELELALADLLETDPDHAGTVFVGARLALQRWAFDESIDARADSSGGVGAPAPSSIREAFLRARDLDAIRFRAPSAVNEAVRTVVAREHAGPGAQVALVPIEGLMSSASLHGIPGFDMFTEHLHPTLLGADLIARTILQTIQTEGVFGRAWVAGPDLPTEMAIARLGLTPLDFEIAERRTFHLTHRWPYPEDRSAKFVSDRPKIVQELAESVISHDIDIAEAHFRLGETWFGQGRRQEALLELNTSCEIFPVVPKRFLLAGRLALEEGDRARALDLLTRGAALDPSDQELARWRDRAGPRPSGR